jgi:hypothetical protein
MKRERFVPKSKFQTSGLVIMACRHLKIKKTEVNKELKEFFVL